MKFNAILVFILSLPLPFNGGHDRADWDADYSDCSPSQTAPQKEDDLLMRRLLSRPQRP